MKKLLILLFVAMFCQASRSEPNTPVDANSLLRDGAPVASAAVIISYDSENGKWMCTFDEEITDTKNKIAPGQSLEMLASSALERVIASMSSSNVGEFRLWGTITKYQGSNYVYPMILLPVTESPAAAEPNQLAESAGPEPNAPDFADPNDKISIPKEVLERLKPRRTVDLQKLVEGTISVTNEDVVFTERSGFIHQDYMKNYVFVPDGLGRSVQMVSLRVLPNAALANALKVQSSEPDRVRFKATGMLTRFDGQYYILLSRATRQYSHGNFAR
ncbi:MAG: hypothetical protein A2Y07_07685 [Planctomycetes bacterium GWF2_50_10]|nr:MAG: hypothetical protein A2Y07_07685 [Planctomycetes bacterium GWF2_50_10]